jgi:hypothetical protein
MFVGSGTALTIAVAASVAAAGLEYYNQTQTEDREDQNEANEINQQSALDKKANQDTQQLLQKDAANNSDTSQKSALMNQFQTALKANAAQATGGLNQVGNVSSAYTKAANDAASGISEYANSQAGDLSSIMAPSLQRQNENAALATYGSQIGAISQQSQGDAALANIKAQGIQANPWLSAAAAGLSSFGSMEGGSAGMLTGGSSSPYGGVMYANGATTPTLGLGGLMVNTTPAG